MQLSFRKWFFGVKVATQNPLAEMERFCKLNDMNTHAIQSTNSKHFLALPTGHAGIHGMVDAPTLPLWALDGRPLTWNADHSAVMFDSTDEEYHSDVIAVSSSALKLMDRSPAHLHASRMAKLLGQQDRRSKALTFGTAVHSAVLEPSSFKKRYLQYPGSTGTGARVTKAYRAFEAANPLSRILLQSEMDDVRGCAARIQARTVIKGASQSFTMADLVTLGAAERNIYWLDKATGLTCKARLDLTVQNIVIDLKTADDARPERFKYDAAKFGYHIQAAFYIEGYSRFLDSGKEVIMLFVVGESAKPHATQVYQADKDAFWMFGQRRVRELMLQYKQCMASSVWPDYSQDAQLLKLPLNKRYAAPQFNLDY